MMLSERKKRLLNLVSYIDSVCGNNNIWYSLAAGSVLGAIRHKGFIPWDEDIDIYVEANHLNKFREAIMKDIPQEFKYYTWEKEYKYHPVFDRLSYAEVSNNSLHIDIFPLIGVPDTPSKRKRFISLCFFSYRFFRCKHVDVNYSHKDRIGKIKFIRLFTYLFSDNVIKKIEKYIEQKYDLEKSNYCYYYSSGYAMNACMPKEIILETHKVTFEYLKLNVPVRYHEYLTNMYGDYMTPKRKGYKIIDKYLK